MLARPGHWKKGRSACEVAKSWFAAGDVPPAVRAVLATDSACGDVRLVEAFFEKRTELDSLGRPSQTDVLALLSTRSGYSVLGVEGKVDETFGPTIGEWDDGSSGKKLRLARLIDRVGLRESSAAPLRYQLLHRTVATLLEADRYGAKDAYMVVQSFSSERAGFCDFQAFAEALGIPIEKPGMTSQLLDCRGVRIRIGWAEDKPSNGARTASELTGGRARKNEF